MDNGNVSAEVVVSEPMENEIVMSPSQPPPQSFDADIAKPSTGAVEGDSETQPTNAERDINERVQPNDPEKPLGYNEKSSDLPIRKDSTATSVMSEKSASVDVEETVGLALDLNGIPPTLQGGSSRILGTPQRTRSALARDPVMGTPVMGSTPLGAPITPSFGFGSPLIRDSFTNSPALPSSVGSSRAQSPVKSPSCMPNTPIKVFSPATGATPTSVKSVLTSPSKSSIMDDAQQFTQLSPATSRTVAGSAKSPVKQPPQSSPSAGVHSSPLGLYGVGMPSSPLKRSHDRASSSHHDVPSTLDISTGTSYESLLDSQRELPSPSLNPMVIPAVKSGSPGFSPLKQKHKMPPLESKTEASKLGMNVTSSPVRRTRQSALFDDDEPSRIGILGMAVLSSPVKRSPKVSSEKDSPVNYSSTADGSRPAGYDSLFDDTFSLSPVRVSPQKSVSDDGEELAPMTSLSPNNTPSSKAERPRPVGYDSLFDDTYSLSPVKILQQEAIIEEPSTTKSPKQDVSFPVKESTNNGSTLANVQMSPPKQMASQDIHSESSTRRLPSKRPAGYDSLFDETYSLSPVRITPQKRMLDIADESAALQPSRATSPRKLTPEPLLNVSPPINADLVKVTTSQEPVLDGVDEKSTLFKPALGPVVVSNVTSPTKRSPSKRPAGYDSLFDDTYSLTPVRVSPPRQMLLDVAEAESLIQLSPKPVSLVTSPSSAAQGPVSGVASPVKESSPKNTLLDEIHTPQLEDEPPTAQELPKTTPSPAKQPSNSYQGIPSPDQPSPSEKAEMLRPAGYDSLFDETFSLSPVRVTPQKRVLDETDEAPEFGRETHPSPVKHSPKIASVLADDESSRLGLHKMNIPSSPATVLSVSVPETAPQSSPSKRLLPSSPIYRSSSFSPEEAGSAGFDSFDDTACTLSPVRLPPQKTASVLASAGKGSTKLGLQNTPLLQSSPIKQPPIYQPSSPAPPTNDEGSRLELNSMDFSLIEPYSGPTPRGQKSGFVGSTPVRQSSGLFSEDGSPSIPMSAKPTPGYSGGLSVEEPSRFGLDGMTIQSSPVKQPLRTDGESLRPEIGIPSSPPIAGINAYGRMLPGDINDGKVS